MLRKGPSGPDSEALPKYLVGPEWCGAKYQTIGAAIEQAELNEPGSVIQIFVYPGDYYENVVVPATLERCAIIGFESSFAYGVGPVVQGTFTWNLAPGGRAGMGVSVTGGPVVFNDPGNVDRAYIEFGPVTFLCDATINSPSTALGADIRCKGTLFADTLNGGGNSFRLRGGSWLDGGTFVTQSSGRLTGVDMKGIFNTAWNLHSNASSWQVSAGCEVWGAINFSGYSCGFRECYIDYPGPPAITDACTFTSFCQGNSFAHNSGPGTFAYVKTGTALLHPGGNTFLEGQNYPWYDIQAGTVHSGGAEMDVELRRLLQVTGTVVLTPIQVGSQRKTTVYKTDGGGSVTLPAIATVEPGCTIPVVDGGNATASPWLVQGTGGELINGAATVPFILNNQAREFQATTTGWTIIGAYL